jgi:hypothetical protein
MSRREETSPEAEPAPAREDEDDDSAQTKSATAPIDEDVAGSVNAALPEADEHRKEEDEWAKPRNTGR